MSFYKWRQRLAPQSEQAAERQDTQFIDLSAFAHQGNTRWHIVLSLGNGVELTLSQQLNSFVLSVSPISRAAEKSRAGHRKNQGISTVAPAVVFHYHSCRLLLWPCDDHLE
jgi:hypothetical protein